MKDRYTAERVAQALRDTKGLVSLAAKRLGCSAQTVRNYVERYPTVQQTLHDEREAMVDIGELALYKSVQDGEAWAVCFILKCLGKERGYVERAEYTGKDGAAIRHEVEHGGAIEVRAVDYRMTTATLHPLPAALSSGVDEEGAA
jgi:predicted transcriptional regulator